MGNKKNPNIEVKTYIVQGDTSKVYKAKTATTIKASIASVEVEKIESERSDAIKAAVAKVREDFKDRVKAARKAIVVTEISGAKLLDLGDFEVVDLSAAPEPEATESEATEEQDAQQDADEGAGEAEAAAQEQDGF